jgi:hypothetical protein
MVIPPSMFEPPGTAEWPPLRAANGHCVNREIKMTIHCGNINLCCAAQKLLMKVV